MTDNSEDEIYRNERAKLFEIFKIPEEFQLRKDLFARLVELLDDHGKNYYSKGSAFTDFPKLLRRINAEIPIGDGGELLSEKNVNDPLGAAGRKRYPLVGPFLVKSRRNLPTFRYIAWLYLVSLTSNNPARFQFKTLAENIVIAAQLASSKTNQCSLIISSLAPKPGDPQALEACVASNLRKLIEAPENNHAFVRQLAHIIRSNQKKPRSPPPTSGVDVAPYIELLQPVPPPPPEDEDEPEPPPVGFEPPEDPSDLGGRLSRNWYLKADSTTGVSNVLWNPLEKAQLISEWSVAFDSADVYLQHALALMMLSYATGIPLKEWFDKKVGEGNSLSPKGHYRRSIPVPERVQDPAEGAAHLFEERLDVIDLPLHPTLSTRLEKLGWHKEVGRSIGEIIGRDFESVKDDVCRMLSGWGENRRYRLIYNRLAAQLPAEIASVFKNRLFLHLLAAAEHHAPPALLHYYSLKAEVLTQAWNDIQSRLFQAEKRSVTTGIPINAGVNYTSSHSNSVVGVRLKTPIVQEFVARLRQRAESRLTAYDDLVELHNQYVDYTVGMFLWGTGHRPVTDPFPYPGMIATREGLGLIEDKVLREKQAHRLIPLCESLCTQAVFYNRHLAALASRIYRLGEPYRALALAIFRLSEGDDSTGVPWLFHLDINGKKTRSITRSSIDACWSAIHPIRANYGRYFLAGALLDKGVSCDGIEAVLGHGHSNEHVFGRNSEYSPVDMFSEISTNIEEAVRSVGWQPLEGIRSYSLDLVAHAASRRRKVDSPHYHDKLGPELREENRKDRAVHDQDNFRRIAEKLFTEKYGTYDEIKFRPTKEDAKALKSIVFQITHNNTTRRGLMRCFYDWLELKGKRRRSLDYYLHSLPAIDAPSPFGRSSLLHYEDIVNTRHAFLMYLNDAQKFGSSAKPGLAQRCAEVVMSSVLFGGIYAEDIIESIVRSSPLALMRINNVVYCEIYARQGESEKSELCYRWLPDTLSTALMLGQAKISGDTIDSAAIEMALSDLIRALGLNAFKRRKSSVSFVSELGRVLSTFEVPGYIRVAQEPVTRQVLLSQNAWYRHHSNGVGWNDASGPPLTDKVQYLAFPGDDRGQKEFKTAMNAVFSRTADVPPAGRNRTKKDFLKTLSGHLAAAMANQQDWPASGQVLCEWLIKLSESGTIQERYPAIGTIERYYRAIYRSILKINFSEFLRLGADEHIDHYQELLERVPDKNLDNVLNPLRQFHSFLVARYGVEDIPFPGGWCGPNSDRLSCRGSIVTEQEYLLAHQWMQDDPRLDGSKRKFVLRMLLLLGYRFGLRYGEALRLMSADIQEGYSWLDSWIQSHNSIYGQGKTDNATRQVPNAFRLTESEEELLHAFMAGQAVKFQLDSQALALGGAGRVEVDGDSNSKYINQLLRWVTGDSTVRYHSLRHSWLFNVELLRTAQVPKPESYNEHGLHVFRSDGSGARGLRAASQAMGHVNPATSLCWYLHTADMQLHRWVKVRERAVSEKALSYCAGIQYSTLKKRRKVVEGDVWSLIDKEIGAIPEFLPPARRGDEDRHFYDGELPFLESLSILDTYLALLEIDSRRGNIQVTADAVGLSVDHLRRVADVANRIQQAISYPLFRVVDVGADDESLRRTRISKKSRRNSVIDQLKAVDARIASYTEHEFSEIKHALYLWELGLDAKTGKIGFQSQRDLEGFFRGLELLGLSSFSFCLNIHESLNFSKIQLSTEGGKYRYFISKYACSSTALKRGKDQYTLFLSRSRRESAKNGQPLVWIHLPETLLTIRVWLGKPLILAKKDT